MSEQNANPTPESSTDSQGADSKRCRRGSRRGRWGRRLGVFTVLALGLFALPRAFGWGGGHHCDRGGAMSSEEVREHMGFVSDHALDEVDATDAQYASIEAILDEAAPKIVDTHQEARALKQRLRETLIADPTNRAALEEIRQEGLALADRASSDAMDKLSEAAAVLTPEQRATLADRASKRWGDEGPPR